MLTREWPRTARSRLSPLRVVELSTAQLELEAQLVCIGVDRDLRANVRPSRRRTLS
jgi:hypothetical protein